MGQHRLRFYCKMRMLSQNFEFIDTHETGIWNTQRPVKTLLKWFSACSIYHLVPILDVEIF